MTLDAASVEEKQKHHVEWVESSRPLATGSKAVRVSSPEETVWASPMIETETGQSYFIGGWVKLTTDEGWVEMGRLAVDAEKKPIVYAALTSDHRSAGWIYVNQRLHPSQADYDYRNGAQTAKDTEADRIPKMQAAMRLQFMLENAAVEADDVFVIPFERSEASALDALPKAENILLDMAMFLELIERWSKLDKLGADMETATADQSETAGTAEPTASVSTGFGGGRPAVAAPRTPTP
jgi:hypothetical protein